MFNTNHDVFRAILDGLRDDELTVVLTVGENNDPQALEPIPANARVERFVPQSLLLHRCTAVVSHGGSGTILPALARGIPQVILPQGADNFTNAARCERVGVGVGIAIAPDAASPATIRAALRRSRDEPAITQAARRVATKIAAMPGPEPVARQLEALVT